MNYLAKGLWTTLTIVGFGVHAAGLTVTKSSIACKTNLVAVASATVLGQEKTILVDKVGMSLYTFDLDSNNVSACSGPCLTVWPPLHVPAESTVAAPFGTINGNDGQQQFTLNGMPLYYFNRDRNPGDTLGQYPKWDVITVTVEENNLCSP